MKRLTLILPTALAALTLVGCGGDTSNPTASSRDKALDGALKFARCMRGEGIDFPDPQKGSNGLVKVGGGPRQNAENPRNRAAAEKCRKYFQGGGEAPNPELKAEVQDGFVKYARCMRSEGVDVPDPKAGAGGLVFDARDPNAPDVKSPKYKDADRKCHRHLADIDKTVQGEASP